MRRRVFQTFSQVVRLFQDLTVSDQHRAYRHLSFFKCTHGLFQRQPHEKGILIRPPMHPCNPANIIAFWFRKKRKEEYVFFGEALVKLGLISEEELIENLKEYNMLKINSLKGSTDR
jgi:hypothetical protein